MSFASFAIGSNDVVATSIAPSIAVLIISAISTNAIASSSAISSSFVTSTASAATSTRDRDDEVDPHVPLRAQHVDDPLERVVEASRSSRGGRRACSSDETPARGAPSRRRGRSRAGAAARATSGHRHVSPTTCGQRTTSPSARGTPVRQRVAAVDREREHVGRLVDPEVLALQRAHLVRADEREPELAGRRSPRPRARARASSTARPRRPPRRRSGSRPRPSARI